MKYRFLLPLIIITAALLPALHAEEKPDADTIVTKANDAAYYAGKDGRSNVRMTITDASGGTRVREFTILRLNTEDKKQKFYVFFNEPADVRRMAYLVWKNPGGNDERWLFLPALGLVRPIAPGDKRTSFVGSDFVYEDVSGRGLKEDKHELKSENDTRYVIRNTPVNPDSVEFAYYDVHIDKDTFLPRKAEYFDKNDKLYRTVEGLKTEIIDGQPTITESLVSDLNTGSKTQSVFSNVKYNIGLDEKIFSERFLRRPPREVLQ